MKVEDLKDGDRVILRGPGTGKDGKVEAVYLGRASSVSEAMKLTGTEGFKPKVDPIAPLAVFEVFFNVATSERAYAALFIQGDGSLRSDPGGKQPVVIEALKVN
jgi:hypothetical protein